VRKKASNEKEISQRQGVVANTLKLCRNGAVGFIDWLDRIMMTHIPLTGASFAVEFDVEVM